MEYKGNIILRRMFWILYAILANLAILSIEVLLKFPLVGLFLVPMVLYGVMVSNRKYMLFNETDKNAQRELARTVIVILSLFQLLVLVIFAFVNYLWWDIFTNWTFWIAILSLIIGGILALWNIALSDPKTIRRTI